MTARASKDGWIAFPGGELLLSIGLELPDDHPAVQHRPDLFEIEAPARPSLRRAKARAEED